MGWLPFTTLDDRINKKAKQLIPRVTNAVNPMGTGAVGRGIDRAYNAIPRNNTPSIVQRHSGGNVVSPMAAQYTQGQVIEPAAMGVAQIIESKNRNYQGNANQQRLGRAGEIGMGALGVGMGAFSATPAGLWFNSANAAATAGVQKLRGQGGFTDNMQRNIPKPTSFATDGLNVQNPYAAIAIDLAVGNPRGAMAGIRNLKNLKDVKNIKQAGSTLWQSGNDIAGFNPKTASFNNINKDIADVARVTKRVVRGTADTLNDIPNRKGLITTADKFNATPPERVDRVIPGKGRNAEPTIVNEPIQLSRTSVRADQAIDYARQGNKNFKNVAGGVFEYGDDSPRVDFFHDQNGDLQSVQSDTPDFIKRVTNPLVVDPVTVMNARSRARVKVKPLAEDTSMTRAMAESIEDAPVVDKNKTPMVSEQGRAMMEDSMLQKALEPDANVQFRTRETVAKAKAERVAKQRDILDKPETVPVWVKSKFSDKGAYSDVPVIRKVENTTLYQGGSTDGRQFWTTNKKYAEQFGDVKEKTGSFYQVDNGNRVVDVYVEAPTTKIPVIDSTKPKKTFNPQESDTFAPYQSSQQPKGDNPFLKLRETFQDRMIRQKKLQEGAEVADGANPYQAEELFHGRVSSRMEEAKDEFTGLFRQMNDYSKSGGIEFNKLRGAVNKYLQATHTPERNLQHGAGAAGMTNAQAQQTLKELADSPHGAAVTEFAATIKKMSDQALDILQEGGVVSAEQVATLRKTYKNHVPLNRIMDEDDAFSVLSGKGFDVKSSGIKRAKGSERQVDDIAGNVLANLEQAIVRAEKNRYGLNVLEFARKNKDLDMFEVTAPKFMGEMADGKILTNKNLDNDTLSVFENGKQVLIKVKDPKLAEALKGVSVEQVPAMLRPVAAITRFYSSVATRFNPEFVLSNIVRDSQELAVYIASQADMPKGSVSAVTKEIPASLADVRNYLKGNTDSAGIKLYAQMIKDGGTTGGMGLSTRGQVQLDISKLEKLAQSKPRQAAKQVVDSIDGWNQMFEDATRLAAYKQAIKSGASRERAASIAKNATINFNRKGTAGTIVNSLYMFSNASIQGSTKVLTSMKNPKVAAATIASVAAPVWAINTYNDAVDPDWRDKVPEWDRQSNMVVMIPSDDGAKYVTIPVSWGLKPIKVMADQSYDIANGKSGDSYQVASDIVSSFVDAYNPAGGTDLASGITPTILDMPSDIARNQKWSGSPIRDDNELIPNHQNHFKSLANTPLGRGTMAVTEKVADATNNRIDINPADLNYAIQQLIGGAGRSAERVITTASNSIKGEGTDVKEIPFVNRFVKSQDQEQVDKSISYRDRDEFEKQLKKMKVGSDEQKQFVQEYLWSQPKEKRQGIMYGLGIDGVPTKGLTIKDKDQALVDREIEAKGQEFLNSGKSIEVVGDKVFRANDTERGYSITSKVSYDADVMETKKTRLKKQGDVEGWMKNAEALYQNYEEQLKDPKLDDLEKMKIEGKMEDLLTEGQKYAGYGGAFKAPAKGRKAAKITIPKLSMGGSGGTAKAPQIKNIRVSVGGTGGSMPKGPTIRKATLKRIKV